MRGEFVGESIHDLLSLENQVEMDRRKGMQDIDKTIKDRVMKEE